MKDMSFAVLIGIPEEYFIARATVRKPDRKILCARKTHIHLQALKKRWDRSIHVYKHAGNNHISGEK